MAFQVPAIFKAIDKMSPAVSKMQRNMNRFTNRASIGVAKLDRGLRRLTPSFAKLNGVLGSFGLFLGATALVGAAGNAIDTFKDFEQANANLASVLNITFEETQKLQESSKQLGSTTAFTASEVAGLQTEYAKLGFAQEQILGATKATLDLAAATRTELPQAAVQVGAAIKAFGLEAQESSRVADVFAASTSKSALDMEKLNVAMSKVAPVANQFGFSIEDSTALLGKLADAGFDASTAATSTRNILLNLADSNGKLAKELGRPVNTMPELVSALVELREKGVDLAEMLNLTDRRSVAAFATFLEGAEGVGKLSAALNEAGGTAQMMAEKQLDTLDGSLTKLSSAYEGFILSQEDGQGAFASTLRNIIDVAAEMLNLMSGTAKASSELSEKQKTLRSYAETALTVGKLLIWTIGIYLSLRAAVLVARGAIYAYNVAVGIQTALTKGNIMALRGNAVALAAYRVAMSVATAANWLFNASNPVGWIMILVGILATVITYWDDWGSSVTAIAGAAASFFTPVLGWLGLVVSLVMSVVRHWDSLVEAFKEGGIIDGLKRIGFVLLDAVLMPVQQLLELISQIPGMGNLAGSGAAFIQGLRDNLDAETAVNPKADEAEARITREERLERQQVDINIRGNGNGQADVKSRGIAPKLTPTFQFD